MENIAYLHLASTYEDCPDSELISLSHLLNRGVAPEWGRFSSKAWKQLLPLALAVSLLSTVGSALALQKGDNGPSVSGLQQQLQRAGFYQAPISRVYDKPTEDAVRRFQKAAGIRVDGVAGVSTLQKLEGWRSAKANPQPKKAQVVSTTLIRNQAPKAAAVKKPQTTQYLKRGDEGEVVRVLQEQLRVAGYYYGNATGIFGPITEESVKRFQEAYNLDTDGVVGPNTRQKLPPSGIGFGDEAKLTSVKVNRDNLRQGHRGEAVRVLQAQLIEAGYLKGEPNGYFGSYTAAAVRRFQADNYLAASGIAGPTTRGKLHSQVKTAPKSEFNVMEVQRRLRVRGFYKGPLNGVMDQSTKRAIKQAQQFYDISLNDLKNGRYW